MRHRFPAMVGVLVMSLYAGVARGGARVVDPVTLTEFDPADSAALFVGVRGFTFDTSLTEVRYAVDDAVDLAYELSLDGRARLVVPSRIVLALSGEPQKEESRQHLEKLLAAGATRAPATQSDVLTLLDKQAGLAGSKGLLIFSFATHGYSEDGTHYLLTASSLLRHHRYTTVMENVVRDIAAQSKAARSLILLDACRQRLTSDSRVGEPDPRSAAPLIRAMAGITGQVVFSAAAVGEYAYDDDERHNGVFTAAVIDGLRCEAPRDERGFVTIDTLAEFVDDRVRRWIQRHQNPRARRVTQLNLEGSARSMPLANCRASTARRE